MVTLPNGEPPVGGSKIPSTVNEASLPGREEHGDPAPDLELVILGEPVVDERAVVAEVGEDVLRPSFHVS